MATDFIAGCIGGCAGVLVGHPFDTVKVRLQNQCIKNPLYKGTIDCFVSTIKRESIFGLYKGMASPLYGLAAINCIVFGVQGNVQRRLNNPDSITSHFLAGSIAGLAQCVICSPMELAKINMQVQENSSKASKYKGPVDCLRKLYRQDGVRGVSRGFWLTVLRETPSFGVYFAAYETFCQMFTEKDTERELGTIALLVSGGCAGMCSWLSTYPIDVIKTRYQASEPGAYKGIIDCAIKSYHEEGMGVFSRGLSSTMLRAFPTNAATFATVTYVLRWMKVDEDMDYAYEMTQYARSHHPPHAHTHLPVVATFPSHP